MNKKWMNKKWMNKKWMNKKWMNKKMNVNELTYYSIFIIWVSRDAAI